MGFPHADVGGAISRAVTPGTSRYIGLSMEAMARRGIVSHAMDALKQRNAQQQQNARRAAAGPQQQATSSAWPRQEPEPLMDTQMQSRGGRRHVGQINERLGDISQREETSTAMDQTIENVLTTNTAGRGTIPNWVFGRRRGGA